jgi:hypothetical protein
MVILNKWREARTTGMRKDFEEAIAKAPGPKAPARSAFLNTLAHAHGTLLALCWAASPTERGPILRYAKKAATNMWRQGAWPSALGFEIATLNVASRFVPDADAAYVRSETDKIIEEALRAQGSKDHVDLFPHAEWTKGGTAHLVSRLVSRRDRRGREQLRQLATEARQIKQVAFAEIADQMFHTSHPASR